VTLKPELASIRTDLGVLVGAEYVLAGAECRAYETDWTASRGLRGKPDAVTFPGSSEEVRQLVEWSSDRGVPLVPRGGGTGLAGGAVPVGGGVVVCLERLDQIIEFSPDQWRLTVGAGVTTHTVKRLARENGLLFPPDPGAAEQSQIGGNTATNAGGPHAFKYGGTGAWVTGLEAVVVPGEIIRVGGAQRKDVGGYDIKSLLVGSEGTLALITEVTLRLLPAPEAVVPLVMFFADTKAATESIRDIIASGIEPAALDYLDARTLELLKRSYPGDVPPDAMFALVSELDGSSDQVADSTSELRELVSPSAVAIDSPSATDLWRWRDGVGNVVAAVRGGKVSEDIVVPPDRLAEAVDEVVKIGRTADLEACSWGHAGDGNMHASFLVDPDDEAMMARAEQASQQLFDLAIALGGSITGEHGVGYLKAGQLERQWDPAALDLHERIKKDFDPAGVLNPGKKVARMSAGPKSGQVTRPSAAS